MIRIQGKMEQDWCRCHHTSQKGMQFQTYELLMSVILHLIFWTAVDCGSLKPQNVKAWKEGDHYTQKSHSLKRNTLNCGIPWIDLKKSVESQEHISKYVTISGQWQHLPIQKAGTCSCVHGINSLSSPAKMVIIIIWASYSCHEN